ncbi:hypothetical protein ACFL2R_02490 [Patescibacteria group bacterium]
MFPKNYSGMSIVDRPNDFIRRSSEDFCADDLCEEGIDPFYLSQREYYGWGDRVEVSIDPFDSSVPSTSSLYDVLNDEEALDLWEEELLGLNDDELDEELLSDHDENLPFGESLNWWNVKNGKRKKHYREREGTNSKPRGKRCSDIQRMEIW